MCYGLFSRWCKEKVCSHHTWKKQTKKLQVSRIGLCLLPSLASLSRKNVNFYWKISNSHWTRNVIVPLLCFCPCDFNIGRGGMFVSCPLGGGVILFGSTRENCLVSVMKKYICWERKTIGIGSPPSPNVSNGPPLSHHRCKVLWTKM